ncbi:MAG: hypothetical protein Q4Q24_01210 [Methanobrevibacter ruminantium]|uniref:hypothetical protein n=1 Tax=Methanobrevibacter ruminantium TaxID=83816 RepID=UPI0026EC62F5|nr:hypothetical protein [Methanobrevibacter ruminantium]MCI5737157.1 hypothetical protein [Methanobrevibacter ruminantium]MDD6049444.1 hypothetical protein [Methanobrevibacter ruminantium]MDO5841874.1 hypothetical protein [Methanobrevibacter ruminantium]
MVNREECVIFKQEFGNELLVNQSYVGIRTKEDGMMSFNLRVPKDQITEIESYFKGFKIPEPILIDIACTGNIHCYFKGISPIIEKPEYSFISVTVQELKQEVVDEEQEIGIPAHECVGCGLH